MARPQEHIDWMVVRQQAERCKVMLPEELLRAEQTELREMRLPGCTY